MNVPLAALKPQSFESFLMARSFLSPHALKVAQRERDKNNDSLENTLLSLHLISEKKLTEALGQWTELPLTDLESPDLVLLEQFPKTLLDRLTWMPFKKEGKDLHIALKDPLDKRETNLIKHNFPDFNCVFYVAPSSQIQHFLSQHRSKESPSLEKLLTMLDESSPSLPSTASTQLIPRILTQCLYESVLKRASDIHFQPESKSIHLRLRMDGHLQSHLSFHKDFWDSLCVHIKVSSYMNIAESRLPQNGRFSREINGVHVDFRVSTHPTKHGESIVMRILNRHQALFSLKDLGFGPSTLSQMKETIESKEGLFIVSGPTGSGKTTTLYSILSALNSPHRNIMTLEQPIEYDLPFARQTEINENSPFTFASGVRSILRQDPDILFIGEIRDPDTAHMALRASMTGHQVYTTLHAPRALGTLQRLKDLGISPTVLAGSLRGLLSQRLVRKLCLFCRKQRAPTFHEKHLISWNQDHPVFEPQGCKECNGTGYKGRIPLVEFIACNDSFNHLILESAPHSILEKEARKTGYIPLREQGIKLVSEGITSLKELCSVIPVDRDK